LISLNDAAPDGGDGDTLGRFPILTVSPPFPKIADENAHWILAIFSGRASWLAHNAEERRGWIRVTSTSRLPA